MDFYSMLGKSMNYSETENGAGGYATTNSALLDLNFSTSSLRSLSEEEIDEKFSNAWSEDNNLALRWLFFLRDVRGGMGERRSFRAILQWLAKEEPELVSRLILANVEGQYLIPYFGRWDDIFCLFSTHRDEVLTVVRNQLENDLASMRQGKPISLMAKWLPSINTSSKEKVALAKKLASALKMSPSIYRKNLSRMRAYLSVVERDISSQRWGSVDYEAVPSKANLVYNGAFLRHDSVRRREFLSNLSDHKVTVNAGVFYPYEIYSRVGSESDAFLEGMWESFKGDHKIDKKFIVVSDGSGSMGIRIPRSSVTALDVASSLALYFAESLEGEFANKFITFSRRPQMVDVSVEGLHNKKRRIKEHHEVSNTNIEAVFDLILETAVSNHVSQEEMPEGILIISDMEYDECGRDSEGDPCSRRLFDEIKRRFERSGYSLPRLIFWNLCSRTGAIPLIENDKGVALISGFSVQNINMVLSGKIDQLEAMKETLMSKRYDCADALVSRN